VSIFRRIQWQHAAEQLKFSHFSDCCSVDARRSGAEAGLRESFTLEQACQWIDHARSWLTGLAFPDDSSVHTSVDLLPKLETLSAEVHLLVPPAVPVASFQGADAISLVDFVHTVLDLMRLHVSKTATHPQGAHLRTAMFALCESLLSFLRHSRPALLSSDHAVVVALPSALEWYRCKLRIFQAFLCEHGAVDGLEQAAEVCGARDRLKSLDMEIISGQMLDQRRYFWAYTLQYLAYCHLLRCRETFFFGQPRYYSQLALIDAQLTFYATQIPESWFSEVAASATGMKSAPSTTHEAEDALGPASDYESDGKEVAAAASAQVVTQSNSSPAPPLNQRQIFHSANCTYHLKHLHDCSNEVERELFAGLLYLSANEGTGAFGRFCNVMRTDAESFEKAWRLKPWDMGI